MDSRVCRVGEQGHLWYDVDFPDVIAQRKRYYTENEYYSMLSANVTEDDFLSKVQGTSAIVVMEGISMYLKPQQLQDLMARLSDRFEQVRVLMDCYTEFAAKASKYKNPINDVGVTEVYGLDEPEKLETSGLIFVGETDMTPSDLIEQLQGMERTIFRKLYAGSIARKMYRLYEYEK
jgi:O-methyltransferase involved in polyketide biosynthesis